VNLLKFCTTYHTLRRHLGDSNLETALVTREKETKAVLVSLFGEDWRTGYTEFAHSVHRYREMGDAVVPLLALGISVPELPPEAAYLVAAKVIDYRKGIRPKTTQQRLREEMAKARKRRR